MCNIIQDQIIFQVPAVLTIRVLLLIQPRNLSKFGHRNYKPLTIRILKEMINFLGNLVLEMLEQKVIKRVNLVVFWNQMIRWKKIYSNKIQKIRKNCNHSQISHLEFAEIVKKIQVKKLNRVYWMSSIRVHNKKIIKTVNFLKIIDKTKNKFNNKIENISNNFRNV